MELIGMTIGSISLGGVADTIGRRSTILGCLAAMFAGMYMATTADNVVELSIWRVITGLGIGGLLPAITAMTAEFSNLKRRHFCVAIMTIGYPIGGIVGGSIASSLLIDHDWRSVFYFGAAITAFFIPVFYFLVPESVYWLVRKQPARALEKVNHSLKRMGHETVTALPELAPEVRKKSVTELFAPGLISITLLTTFAYFLHMTSIYFILKWVPKIVVDMGFTAAAAGGVLVYANVGGAIGGATFGLLTLRFNLKRLTMGFLVCLALFIAILGQTPTDLFYISVFVAVAGSFGVSSTVGMYALIAHLFPTQVRASGTGIVIGTGRGGAILSPIIAGFMFKWGLPLSMVSLFMGTGAFIAAGILIFLRFHDESLSANGQPTRIDSG
jgi:MFS family permease